MNALCFVVKPSRTAVNALCFSVRLLLQAFDFIVLKHIKFCSFHFPRSSVFIPNMGK